MTPSPFPQTMTPLRLALTVVLTASALPLFAADDPLKSFTPDKPGLRFIPSTPAPPSASARLYPPQYIQAVSEVLRAFRLRDWPRTRAALDAADKILPPTPVTLNVRGAVLIEEKHFEEGAQLCQEALKIDPKFYPARFNLAEIPLVQGRYAESRKMFEKFVRDNPKDELARFRVFLTLLLEKNYDDARRTIDQIPFPGDTPSYYYANAAWEFAHESPEEAKKWLGRADWTFGPDKCATFADSLYEIGWMKRADAKKEELKLAPQ
jgi:tetratricopeptide (TPR) repeat protein